MSLNDNRGTWSQVLRIFPFAPLLLMILWAGCSSSEEATQQDRDQEALSSFVGDRKPEIAQPPPVDQRKMEQLETENVTLKQRIVKLEQDNHTLSAKLADLEAKIAAEREAATRAAAKPAVEVSMTAYERGLKAFNAKEYEEAIRIFQGLLDGGIEEELADNCHYWIGESYYGKRMFQEAIKQFEVVFQYRTSEKRGDAQFMIAQSFERLGQKDKAKEAYEKLVKDFPTSDKVNLARQRWGML